MLVINEVLQANAGNTQCDNDVPVYTHTEYMRLLQAGQGDSG